MTAATPFREAMRRSTRLMQEEKYEEALEILDGAIALAMQAGENSYASTLCHHAANIARFGESADRARHYYEQSLVSNPENPRALEGLAEISGQRGHIKVALEYARRSYEALMKSEDDLFKQSRLERLLRKWPGVISKRD